MHCSDGGNGRSGWRKKQESLLLPGMWISQGKETIEAVVKKKKKYIYIYKNKTSVRFLSQLLTKMVDDIGWAPEVAVLNKAVDVSLFSQTFPLGGLFPSLPAAALSQRARGSALLLQPRLQSRRPGAICGR